MPGMTITHGWWGSGGKHYQWYYILQQSGVLVCDMKINFKNKWSTCMDFPISPHSRTAQKIACVTLSMLVHLWTDFSLFQGVAPLSHPSPAINLHDACSYFRNESKMCCCLTKWQRSSPRRKNALFLQF